MAAMQEQTVQQEDEISLKDLILKVQEWWRYLLGKWLTILIFGLIGAGLGLTYALFQKPNYIAELTFVLEENKSNPLGSYAGLASQFGIDLGGGVGSGVFAGDNILEFLRSRLMVEKTLLSPVVANGKETSLAELYIDIYELRKGWQMDKELQEIHFPIHADRKHFSMEQDSILNTLYQEVVKKNIAISKPDKKLSFILVKCISKNQLFSKIFTETLVKEATDFYVETKTKRSKANVDLLQAKADSLETLLNQKTVSAATARDLNLNPARQLATVSTEVMSRDKLMLQTVYGEVIKNLELSRMAMAQETPLIQIVDTPILPLRKEKLGKLKGLITGGLLGGFLTILIFFARRLFKQIMN
jgi:hypothetical protein